MNDCWFSLSLFDKLLYDRLPLFLRQPRQRVVVGGQGREVPDGHGALLVALGGEVGWSQVVGQLLLGLGLGVEQVLNLGIDRKLIWSVYVNQF